MALDGVTIASIVSDLAEKTISGRVDKIYQPEKDEIIINIRSQGNNWKLLLTASSSHPRLHFTAQSKSNPMQAPLFCMVLRKHLMGGKILRIEQPQFERIVEIYIESLNELGDLSTKRLVIEIMGKHSNIILLDEQGTILDSSKHITHETSSVREVLPGKKYVYPPSQEKESPLLRSKEIFEAHALQHPNAKALELLYQHYSGISPFAAVEICYRTGVTADAPLPHTQALALYTCFDEFMMAVEAGQFCYTIYYKNGKPMEFSTIQMRSLADLQTRTFATISELLEFYYSEKDLVYRMGQKTVDVRKIIQLNIERCAKKRDLYNKTLKEIQNREQMKIYGELVTSHIYSIEKGMTTYEAQNFYAEMDADGKYPLLPIPLDPMLTPAENAQKYFKKYNKEKRTHVALQEQIKQNNEEMTYLEYLVNTLTTCQEESDIEEIRDELAEQGFVKKRRVLKGMKPKKAKPLRYESADGFEIFVGKNNKQNDELTLRIADKGDLWLHTKEIPGSHVIVKTGGKSVPDETLNQAAMLAAFYSKARSSSQVPVDYTLVKFVKKPSGAKPGMVIYTHNQTAYVTPSEDDVKRMEGQMNP